MVQGGINGKEVKEYLLLPYLRLVVLDSLLRLALRLFPAQDVLFTLILWYVAKTIFRS